MTKQEPLKLWFIAIILIAFMSTWAIVSNSQNEQPSSIGPTVTATTPADGATAVALNQGVSVTFSQAMSVPSMAACLILKRPDGTLVNGTVTTIGRTSIFRSLTALAPNALNGSSPSTTDIVSTVSYREMVRDARAR